MSGDVVSPVDLDSTEGCPLGVRCESCGREGDDLAVGTAELGPLGIACLTLCGRCGDADMAPPVAVGTAVRLVMQHASHLGIDVDEMAAVIERNRKGGR